MLLLGGIVYRAQFGTGSMVIGQIVWPSLPGHPMSDDVVELFVEVNATASTGSPTSRR